MNKRIRKKQWRWGQWCSLSDRAPLGKARSANSGLYRKVPNYGTNYGGNVLTDKGRWFTKRYAIMHRELTGGDRRRLRILLKRGLLTQVYKDISRPIDDSPLWIHVVRATPAIPDPEVVGPWALDWRLFVFCLRDGLTDLASVPGRDTVSVGRVRRGRYAGQWRAFGALQWSHHPTREEAVAAADRFY